MKLTERAPETGSRPARTRLRHTPVVAIALVGICTCFVYLASALKDIGIAYYFGRSSELDAYVLALGIFVFLLNTIGGSFATAAVPIYIREHEGTGAEAGQRVIRGVALVTALILALAGAVVGLVLPTVLATLSANFPTGQVKLVRLLIFVLLPAFALGGLTSVWRPILNARGRFALPAITPAFAPLATICLLLAVGADMGSIGLATGVVIGSILEFVVVALYMRKLGMFAWPTWSGLDPHLASVFQQTGPLILAGCVSMGAVFADQLMAASLGSGDISGLNYGIKVVTVGLGLASVAMTSVLFPQFARLFLTGDRQQLRGLFIKYLSLAMGAAALGAIAIIEFSEPIVRLLFQRGAFTESDTSLVSGVQVLFALQLPFHVGSLLTVRLLSAMRRNQILLLISSVMLVLDVSANYALMQILGVAGIALSTSLVFACSFTMLFLAASRALRDGGARDPASM